MHLFTFVRLLAKLLGMPKHNAAPSAHKRVPCYWWDFGPNDTVIVQSDDDRFALLGRFTYDASVGEGAAASAINQATRLIGDLQSGRVSPFKLAL